MKKAFVFGALLTMGVLATACRSTETQVTVEAPKPVFYTEAGFDTAAAKQAYFDMMKKLGAPVFARYSDPKDPNFFWVVDFAQGEFDKLGMGGVFWVNDLEQGYFAHEIFLLPGQSIAEHCHMVTSVDGKEIKPKHESWQVRYGSVYGFSEVGEPNLEQYPELKAMLTKAHLEHLKSFHVEKWEADGSVHALPEIRTWHFMMGGPDGAVVSEYATYHHNSALRFAIPGVAF